MTVRVYLLNRPAAPGMLVRRRLKRPWMIRTRLAVATFAGILVAAGLLWHAAHWLALFALAVALASAVRCGWRVFVSNVAATGVACMAVLTIWPALLN